MCDFLLLVETFPTLSRRIVSAQVVPALSFLLGLPPSPMTLRYALLLLASTLCLSPALAQSPEDWQQHVDYEMDIRLDTEQHRMDGWQRLTYTNNSRDTLHTVYYHLYFNAFHPESMMAERNRQLPDPDGRVVPRIFQLEPDEQGWYRIESLTQDGTPVSYDINETIMRVDLASPIAPGESTTFEMDFESQVPLQTRRSGRDSRGDSIDYTMTQWYPKMAEYDERGWHANPYINREYYAPFGSFDVEITLPAHYTIGATGTLENATEVGHGYSSTGNTTYRPEDGPSPNTTDSLTWHFTADNVHNFAWSADPAYIHKQVVDGDYTFHLLYKEEVAKSWEPLQEAMPDLTQFFGEKFGEYPYPQMTVAQGGDGGMEYPMFTVVTGYNRPEFEEKAPPISVLGTTVHEYAHMWYYGALASNEADYAWIDEGFASYATEEGMAHLLDREPNHQGATQGVAQLQKMGLLEPWSTPADWFTTNVAYGVASYSGGEMVVDMLGYVISDSLRNQWFQRIYNERLFQHPDPFDLELFAEQESGLMLDWYFWQFTNSTREVDDAIRDLDQESTGDTYEATFTLEREGEAVLPHDVKLTLEDGTTQWVHVPLLSMHGHKPVPDDWIVTEPWPWTHPEKQFTVEVSSPVESAEIDPNGRTPDTNRLNNTTDFPLTTRFLRAPESDWFNYELGIRPLAGYADDFGVGGGLQARGTYFTGEYQTRATLTLWPEVIFSGGSDPDLGPNSIPLSPRQDAETGSWFGGLDYEVRYERPAHSFGAQATLEVAAAKHLGVLENRLALHTPLSSPLDEIDQSLRFTLLHQLNPSDRVFGLTRTELTLGSLPGFPSQTYTQLTNPWGQSQTLSARLDYEVTHGEDRVAAFLEAGSALRSQGRLSGSGFSLGQATRVALNAQKEAHLGPLDGTFSLQFGLGADGLLPHKQFVLGGRPVEAQWRNDAYRQTSALFEKPVRDAHLVAFGSAGPVAYLRSGTTPSSGLAGRNEIAGRVSIGGAPFSDLAPLSPLELDLFSGVGTVWNRGVFLSGLRADEFVGDAGLGARYDLSEIPHLDRWTAQSDVLQGLDVVAKFPVWASDPGLIESGQDEFSFRWLIGVEI